MSRKDEILWALMGALMKKNDQEAAEAPAKEAAAPNGFDWSAEEKVGYDPGKKGCGCKKYYEEEPEYIWTEEPEEYPMKKECHHKKEKECYCHYPWEEEKWICTKESRICCEKIPCKKEKEPDCDWDCGCRGGKLR